MTIKFNDKPEIDSTDDISESHQEMPGFDHCIEIHFKEPFCEYDVETDELETATAQNEYDRCQQIYEDFAVENEILLNVDGIFLETACDWRDEQTLWYRFNLLEWDKRGLLSDAICSFWGSGSHQDMREAQEEEEGDPKTTERIIQQHGDTIQEFVASDHLKTAIVKAYDMWLRERRGVKYDGYVD